MTISCKSCTFASRYETQGKAVMACSKATAVLAIEGIGTSVDGLYSSYSQALEDIAITCNTYNAGTSSEVPVSLFVRLPKSTPPASVEGPCHSCSNLERIRVKNYGSSEVISVPSCKATGKLIVDFEDSYGSCKSYDQGIPSVLAAEDVEFGLSEDKFYPWMGLNDTTAFNTLATWIGPADGTSSEDAIKPPPYVEPKVGPNWAKPKSSVSFVDPKDYHSDMAVEEASRGIIKAWRLLSIGEGSKKKGVYLPIFDPEYFTEQERLNIPQLGDHTHPELYKDGSGILEAFATESWMEGSPLCFVGEPGSGKTEAARYLAYLMQTPFTHLAITDEALADQFCGTVRYDPAKGTHFVWGRLPLAISRPGVVLSDEVNTGPDSILQMYRTLTSSSKMIFLEDEEDVSKRIVRQHPDCFHLLALNPSWDSRNIGTRELADPDVQRLSFMWLEEPGEADIKEIVLNNLEVRGLKITVEELEGMMSVRRDIKEMSRSGALPYSWSIRQDIKVAIKLAYYPPVLAYKRALLDFCPPDSASAVVKVVQSVFGFTD